jgi:hypothetical protein
VLKGQLQIVVNILVIIMWHNGLAPAAMKQVIYKNLGLAPADG